MLLVIGTQTTIVWAPIMHFCIEFQWHFRLFVVVPNLLIILHIIGNHHLTFAVRFTIFKHKNVIVLKNYFSINGMQTFWTQAFRIIVINIIANLHLFLFFIFYLGVTFRKNYRSCFPLQSFLHLSGLKKT